uniref:Uncharacterized protein n=1 Tax=Ackermannviridae sp. TaxID=2831612 RepID=A0A8S5VKR9_9CAUD|nr:MAG TPA: hypothetical protein [Ackermannviridae sp.]
MEVHSNIKSPCRRVEHRQGQRVSAFGWHLLVYSDFRRVSIWRDQKRELMG